MYHCLKEMMFGTRNEFLYWECDQCGCLQIVRVPSNLSDYYPPSYYSFKKKSTWNRRLSYQLHYIAAQSLPALRRSGGAAFRSILETRPPRKARVLDVGSGSGEMVSILRGVGLDAHGIDPFLKEESLYLRREDLSNVETGWDVIMFHHSLEHMWDQIAILQTARAKLSKDGCCLVRIPIAAWAWHHYGRDWVQLDAPRHLVIHTLTSFELACERAGLFIDRMYFDSGAFQFTGSELYRRDIPLVDAVKYPFHKKQLRAFKSRAMRLNKDYQGDQAVFYLRPVV